MDTQKTIDILNTLIVINNDRIEGYQTASTETKEVDLKLLFSKLMQTSEHCKTALSAEVHKLGGTVDEGTRITGKFFRVWMDVKAALSGDDRKTILDSCEYGEDVALETYADALKDNTEYMTAVQHEMIFAQQILLKEDHDQVKSLRDSLKVHD